MNIFVLIVVSHLTLPVSGFQTNKHADLVTTQEFSSQQSCEQAASAIAKLKDPSSFIKMVCVPK